MSRVARIVMPGYPHHVTQRGNRRAGVFERIRRQTHTGHPCGAGRFVGQLESLLGRLLGPAKRGRKPKPGAEHSEEEGIS